MKSERRVLFKRPTIRAFIKRRKGKTRPHLTALSSGEEASINSILLYLIRSSSVYLFCMNYYLYYLVVCRNFIPCCTFLVPPFLFQIVNAARPKVNIKSFLHDDLHTVLPVESAIDLVLVDFGINDGVLGPFHSDTENVKMAHDVLIRHVRNTMNRSPAMLYMGSFIAPARVAEVPLQGTNLAEIHSEVAQRYDIPMVRLEVTYEIQADRIPYYATNISFMCVLSVVVFRFS